jgi:uncharacterized Zn finger protein
LIDVGLDEGDTTALLHWLDEAKRLGREPRRSLDIANTIADVDPNRSIAIWKREADREIATVKPRGYQEVGRFIRRIKAALSGSGREDEWNSYLNDLKDQNRRRPRCMEVLNGFDAQPIVEL